MFSDQSWNERLDRVQHALADVLAALTSISPTSLVAERVAKRLGDAEPRDVARVLLKIAERHPAASHTGPEVKSFGKVGRRWMWSPGRYGVTATPKVTPYEASDGLSAGQVYDWMGVLFDDWSVRADNADELNKPWTRMWLNALIEVRRLWLVAHPDAVSFDDFEEEEPNPLD